MSRTIPGEAEARWKVHVEKWKSSGLSLRNFAEQEKLNINSLWAWKKRLLGTTPRSAPKLVPLVVASKPSKSESNAIWELVVRSGHTLRAPTDFDDRTLRRLPDALGSLMAKPPRP